MQIGNEFMNFFLEINCGFSTKRSTNLSLMVIKDNIDGV